MHPPRRIKDGSIIALSYVSGIWSIRIPLISSETIVSWQVVRHKVEPHCDFIILFYECNVPLCTVEHAECVCGVTGNFLVQDMKMEVTGSWRFRPLYKLQRECRENPKFSCLQFPSPAS